jgi:hypothetical protein
MLMIWIFLVVAGLWILFTGKAPMVLFGGLGTYRINSRASRIIGVCMVLSALLSFASLVVLSFFDESGNIVYTLVCGLVPVLLVLIGITIAVRRVRNPYPLNDSSGNPLSIDAIETDGMVRKKVQRSMYLLAVGMGLAIVAIPILGVILFPVAYYLANQGSWPAMEESIRERYQNEINFIRLLSVVLLIAMVLMLLSGRT